MTAIGEDSRVKVFILTHCTSHWTGGDSGNRMRPRERWEKGGKGMRTGEGRKWEGTTDKETEQMQRTEGIKLLLTCTNAWTAWTCPAILKLSSPSPLQKEESKEHDVSMLTRQCRFRALYSTRFISRPKPYKN